MMNPMQMFGNFQNFMTQFQQFRQQIQQQGINPQQQVQELLPQQVRKRGRELCGVKT